MSTDQGSRSSIWSVVTRELIIVALTGVILLAISLGLQAARADKDNIWLRALQDFGFAFIEAGLIMLIIEQRAAREQVDKSVELIDRATTATGKQIETSLERTAEQTRYAIEHLFNAVYKQNVPPEIVQLYEETAFRSPFFRTEHEYTCTFTEAAPGEPHPEMIRATFYQSFFIENLTSSEKTFVFSCETQLPATQVERCKYTSLVVDGVSVLDPTKIGTVERVGYDALRLSHAERIVPGPAGRKRFQVRFENLRFRRDCEVVVMNLPGDGIVFTANFPPSLQVALNALHPGELKPPADTADNSKEWKLEAGFVVGQGVCLSWQDSKPGI